ncbi:MAG: lipoxygenase, partial [Vicinamibacteria bacterium]|nr:lipoxygenase [Vicinamibacteria bacterium]
MTLPLLPQDDPQGDRRGAALAWAQQAYTYRYDALAPLATIANLPATEHFDIRYNALQLGTMSRISANMGMVTVRNDLEPFQGLQEYEEFYPLLPKPSSLSNHHDDRSFARQRVAGANPMVLRRVIDARELADMDLAGQFTAITGLPSLEAGVASGQLFVADYRMFADTVTGTHGGRPKWLAPAVALFCWRPSGLADRGGLAPVAIRLSPRSVTVTPKDGAAWQAAKTHVQVADANHHEMSTHLGRTHLVMEPFAIATARQLAPNHPLRLLLDPHLRFNLARNALARETLIKQDGPVDRLLAGTLQSSLKIATEAAASWHFENFKLPNELKSRGVDNADLLPDYPYRDDGLLLWDSIGAFAREYVGLYYS